MMSILNRRNFFKVGGLSVASAVAGNTFAKSAEDSIFKKVPKNLTVLFQGDSITDAGRDRGRYYANEVSGMGRGYVFQVVSQLLGHLPDKSFRFYNRGISGNKVYQLANRWDDDCLHLAPDVLSILIGVNDFWHTLRQYDGTAGIFENDLRRLLDRTKAAHPAIKVILGEPFAVKGGTAIDERWYPEFPKYQKAVRAIAKDFQTGFISYQKIFDEALEHAPAEYWCPDGVHPSMAGGYLMKESWINSFTDLYR
jgi:lysophospholipase L1-like esterase